MRDILFKAFRLAFITWSMTLLLAYGEVDLSGYIDVEYYSRFGEGDYPAAEFDQHHISLIAQHEIDRYKMLLELEWEHDAELSASGGGNATGDGNIIVERAWVDAFLFNWLSFRVGSVLNSTIYQQNHFPSIVVNLTRPQLVKNIFDGSYEGAKVYGKIFNLFTYDFWVSRDPKKRNGGSPNTEHGGLSSGSRLGVEKNFTSNFSLNFGFLFANFKVSSGQETAHHNQRALGAEIALSYHGFTLWSEYGERIDKTTLANTRRGLYSILSYSYFSKDGEFLPFLLYDRYLKNNVSLDAIERWGVGLTFRPLPIISLKAEYLFTDDYLTQAAVEMKSTQQVGLAIIYYFN